MKPSEVELSAPVPLIDTLGRAELEVALAFLVRVCHVSGDAFAPVGFQALREVLLADLKAKREPMASLVTNPFLQPDFVGLVEKGHARWTGEPGKSELLVTEPALCLLGVYRDRCQAQRECDRAKLALRSLAHVYGVQRDDGVLRCSADGAALAVEVRLAWGVALDALGRP